MTLTLDKEADAADRPLLSLYLGDGSSHTWRGAEYYSGSGSRDLVFRYRVKAADLDTDGISVGGAGVDGEGNPAYSCGGDWAINARGTDVQIDYTHGGISHSAEHKVDGRPYVQDARITSSPPAEWDAYRANQIIELTMRFSTDVVVEGSVHAGLYIGFKRDNWSEAWRPAKYLRGSGADTLVFGYTVKPGDMDARAVRIATGGPGTGFGGSGTIKAKGADVDRNPHYLGTGQLAEHRIDTDAPAISSIRIKSRPGNGNAYAAGEYINVDVVFSEGVTFSGNLELALDVGGVTRQAALRPQSTQSGSFSTQIFAATITFQYEVGEEDVDMDGVGISPNSLRLNGGDVRDSAGNAGNAAGLSHAAVAANAAQKVSASTRNQR